MVKTRIDEITPVNELTVQIAGYDDKPLDYFINSVLDECGDDIQKIAPLWKLTAYSCTNAAVRINEYSGYVELPSDFLRLIDFKLFNWERSVTVPVMAGTVAADRQKNRFLRGGTAKPVCVLGHTLDGENIKRTVEYYSTVDDNHNLEKFLYARRMTAEHLNNDLTEALVWHTAGKVLGITGSNLAQIAAQRAQEALIN
jgi:hypothetical protein